MEVNSASADNLYGGREASLRQSDNIITAPWTATHGVQNLAQQADNQHIYCIGYFIYISEGKGIKVGRFTYFKSTRDGKKLMTIIKDPNTGKPKTIHFGNTKYEHFKDKTGLWSELDHRDKERRERYRKRHAKVLKKDGTPAKDDYLKAAFHSWRVLW